MMNQLLRMIKRHKRNQEGLPVEPVGKGKDMGAAGTHGLKRKLEDESTGRPPKRVQKRGSKSSPAQVNENQACRPPSPPDLSTCIGERDSDLRRQDCDLRELRSDAGEQALETQQLFEILLTTLSQAATPASPTDQGNSLDGPMGGKKNKGRDLGSTDPGDLLDLMNLGLPLGRDIDLRRRLKREPQHKACKRSQAGQVKSTSSDQPKEESFLPWRLVPITGLSLKRFCPPVNPNSHDPRFQKVPGAVVQACGRRAQRSLSQDTNVRQEGEVAGGSILDAVVDTEYIKFSEEMQDILKGERVKYRPKSPWPRPYLQQLAFSDYITHHVPPVSTEHYVSMLRQDMNRVIGSQPAPAPCSAHPTNPRAATPKTSPHPRLLSEDVVKEGEDACIRTESLPDQLKAQRKKPFGGGSPTLDPAPVPIPASISSLIGQVKPEVLSSLVEIIKDVHKNTVKFYIHPGSQTSGPEHCQIKEYLKSLGNVEGDPETFLKNSSSLEKLLVIIENQDIAACLHKIPALLSLKSLSRVSFVGVDGPDDLRNHTSNELFVSGGIIVSDEFLLDPDFITHERLQALLTSLMGRSSLENQWHWKIHCKTKKKLKELGSRNSKALLLFNLLCSSRWRHLVEFLPYHDCDAAGRQAPDLSCLIQLQAQNTQRRHAVFLTERRAEMFPGYSNNGILVASIDDIMYRFDDLMGTCDRMAESPISVPPAESVAECSVEQDVSLKGGDMCLDPAEGNPTVPLEDAGQPPLPPADCFLPPLPPAEEFRPPLPETVDMELPLPGQLALDPRQKAETCLSEDRDFNALKYAISQFKASSQVTEQMLVLEQGVASFDPYHSFLGPTLPRTPPSRCLGTLVYPDSLGTPSQQWGYRSVPSQYYPLPGQQGSLQLALPSPAVFPTSSLGSAHLPGEGAMELWVSQQQANQNWARL
ncbi:hypothetical protein AGOR_G00132680 [Albula goreensis]|uniref:Uncharacterized protein n=1 Tax=Albula goreensis TaxID=1534307 RepID=A0A8T3D8I7_9TELE|nr:hypothetical protein AGOR_G00132680 [Albula goreensis]